MEGYGERGQGQENTVPLNLRQNVYHSGAGGCSAVG